MRQATIAASASDVRTPPLHRIVARHAAGRGDAIALTCGESRISYRALDALARDLSGNLTGRGIGAGDRIAFAGRNCAEIALCALAASRIGAVFVPLNWRLARDELLAILADARPALLVADDMLAPIFSEGGADFGGANFIELQSLVALAQSSNRAGDCDDPEAVAIQVYTSGTMGRPKGVMLTHRNLLGINALRDTLDWDRSGPHEVSLVTGPLGHVGAYGVLIRSLFFGGEAVILPAFDVAAALAAIERHKVTTLPLVPTALKLLLDHPDAATTDFGSVETLLYGASPISPTLLRDAIGRIGCRFVQSYGMTETSGPVVALPPADHDPAGSSKMLAAGVVLPGTKLRIVDASGRSCRTGETGEIWIQSIATMRGYWNPAGQAPADPPDDGWLRTGDMGYLDADAYLFVCGRLKEMVISGAENIYPVEVENVLSEHPDVEEVAVLGLPDAHWGEIVVAAVVPTRGATVDANALLIWARPRIAGYKLPKRIRFETALPQSPAGKIDKQALRAKFVGEQGS